MPECDTRVPKTALTDATSTIDAHVNKIIKEGRGKGLKGTALVDHVYKKLGASVTYVFQVWSDDYNKSGIEKWAESLAKSMIYRPKVEETKFKGITYHVWNDSGKGYDRVLSPNIKVTGKKKKSFRIGVDKLGHFAQQGYEYWELVTRKGKTIKEAKSYGSLTEIGKYGLGEDMPFGTGVYSFADLEANLQGYKFYKWLETSAPSSTFALKDYVSQKWNEEINVNSYHTEIVEKVWENLLAAQWKGSFTIAKDDKKKKIPLICTFSETDQTAKGKFKYTHTHGPVSAPFNANISYIPVGLFDFLGIRMDITWASGDNVGRARLTSRDGVTETENKLVGTWGWFGSYDNGGTLSLERQ